MGTIVKFIEYMLVMEVTPIDGRKFKHRKFVNLARDQEMCSGRIMDHEMEEAKKLGVKPSEVLTVNVVALQ